METAVRFGQVDRTGGLSRVILAVFCVTGGSEA